MGRVSQCYVAWAWVKECVGRGGYYYLLPFSFHDRIWPAENMLRHVNNSNKRLSQKGFWWVHGHMEVVWQKKMKGPHVTYGEKKKGAYKKDPSADRNTRSTTICWDDGLMGDIKGHLPLGSFYNSFFLHKW